MDNVFSLFINCFWLVVDRKKPCIHIPDWKLNLPNPPSFQSFFFFSIFSGHAACGRETFKEVYSMKIMEILLTDSIANNYKNPKYAQKTISYFKAKNLLPLYASPELSSIVGHLLGDGELSKDKYVGVFRFFGSEEKLRLIETKIYKIFQIKPKAFFERKGGFVLRYNNCKISRLLELIEVPRGNKVTKTYRVPSWIKNENGVIKKAFLVALSDDELSSPRIDKRGNVEPLRLKFNKREQILDSGSLFLQEVKNIFNEFGIECSSIKLNNEIFISKDGQINRSLYFNISAKRQNLCKFRDNIGFEGEVLKAVKLELAINRPSKRISKEKIYKEI